MVWALRNVFMMIPDSAWEPGGVIEAPPEPQPFDAFRASALRLTSPFRIEQSPPVPAPPRGRRFRVA